MSDFERITSPWDDLFFRYVSSSKESIRIASPFIKSDITKQLLDTKLPKVSLKYVNSFKLQYFYSGASDLGALEAIIQEGGTIRNLQNLHAKLYVFDGSLAIVTSANLTRNGLKNNQEYGILIREPVFVQSVITDFESLYSSPDKNDFVTKAQIREARAIIKAAPKRVVVEFPATFDGADDAPERYLGGPESIMQTLTGWKLEVFRRLQCIDAEVFILADVYKFEPKLKEIYPSNYTIQDKIRQVLQDLRNLGLLKFLGQGTYKKLW